MSELAEVHCAWTESDRGQVGGDGIAIRKCSTEFLSALYKAYQKLATGSLEASVADRLNKSIAQELYRLHLYPTLYPTPEIQSRFRTLLVGGLENYLDEKQKASDDTRLDQNNIIARETDRILDSVNYPSYKPELLPWEQFLLRGSPGSGATFLTSPPNVVLRLMPMGGVALHMNWLQTRYVLGQKCREFTVPNDNILRCAAASAQGPYTRTESLPSTGLRHRQQWRYVTERRDPNVTEKLESLSEVIGDVPVAYNHDPATAPAMIYRSWKENMQIDSAPF
ncbi:hypothetical protein CIHG_02237 [Coccidioides immitis H538.4]|uniref:Uncharacterized protein n=1 Tax=Coccidioides immitis H538.4 TaxID=396776 RepID=A0A0J8RHT6_COCIT|nr:hypothetical protein CIHG_02237 [Coccidioides immitis H538.4]